MKNIQESLGELTKFLNFESTAVPTLVGSQKVNVCFLKTNNVFIELIEPAEENSPISSFTDNGGGFHHLCFEVDNIQKEIETMVKIITRNNSPLPNCSHKVSSSIQPLLVNASSNNW